MKSLKKYFVLVVLFVLPIMVYLFFAAGIYRFNTLPIMVKEVPELSDVFILEKPSVNFKNHITILGFLGENVQDKKITVFNLNEKIYKRFNKFEGFQMLMIVTQGTQNQVKKIVDELQSFTGMDASKWRFVYGSPQEIRQLFEGLKTPDKINAQSSNDFVYIIDKDRNLRGRNDQQVYSYDSASIAEISDTLTDDIKVLLAEYRLSKKKKSQLQLNVNK